MWDWVRVDSGLWNRGCHPGATWTEMTYLSGHTATGALHTHASGSQRSQWAGGGDLGPITYPLDDADQARGDFGVGDGRQRPRRCN